MPVSNQEEDWKAQDDVRTLTEAAAINADGKRLKKATAMAKVMLAEEEAKAKAMKKIAGAKMEYKDKPKEG